MPTRIRTLPPPHPTIVPATDLGGVEVRKRGNLYLLADVAGDIQPDARGLGLYDLDTRVLSCAILRVDGHLTSEVEALRPIAVQRRGWIAGGFAERIELANESGSPRSVRVELDLDADAADIFEVRGRVRPRRGTYEPTVVDGDRVVFGYVGLDGLLRRTTVTAPGASAASRGVGGAEGAGDADGGEGAGGAEGAGSVRLAWAVDVEAGGAASIGWEVVTELVPVPGDDAAAVGAVPAVGSREEAEAEDAAWLARCARITTGVPDLDATIERSFADLLLLRNDGPRPGQHHLAAGVPWYTTLFGRDSIITALESIAFVPDVARETLQVLADWQATELDPERDMEPGKILHELRFGEMARTGEVPYRPYFGTVDATPLWLVLLDETYRWTGDLELVRSLWPNALAALDWIDRFGDRDRDGFVEYERATDGGAPNHGWKDSEDPIRHADGSIAPTPIALAEVQGYVYDAKVRCAALASLLGDEALATRLRAEADELRWRFDAAFWVPALGCYALALDGQKRQVATVASNMGHCLWSGIVRPARVDAVVDRLLESSMDSGWGIRTYAAGQPGFDPLSYHRGSVWPHDNAVIAAGMRRVGRDDGAARIAAEMLEAAQRSPAFRLPELFSGVARAESGASPAAAAAAAAPEPYPVACSPQAWSAATPLSLLQTLLGLEADTAAGILEVTRPSLPAGVAGVAIERLRVRAGVVDIRLRRADRNGDGAIVEVVRQVGPLEVVGRG